MRAYEVDGEAAVGGAAGRLAEVGHTERAPLRRERGPEAARVGVGVAEVEQGGELAAAPALRRRGGGGAAQRRRREEEQQPRSPHGGRTVRCVGTVEWRRRSANVETFILEKGELWL